MCGNVGIAVVSVPELTLHYIGGHHGSGKSVSQVKARLRWREQIDHGRAFDRAGQREAEHLDNREAAKSAALPKGSEPTHE
ncbi:MAG: hypothetical protein Kilf2KO_03670 [Rhodospirillales bacterium]